MSIENRQIFKKNFSNAVIRQFSSSISVRDINNTMHYISEYVVVLFYFDNTIQHDDKLMKTTDRFEAEVHLVNSLKVNFFFNNDVFIAQRIKLNMKNQTIQLKSCQNLMTNINIVIKKDACLKRVVRVKNKIIIFADFIINVSVNFHDSFFDNRDFLFESQCRKYLDENEKVFVHIVDANLNQIIIRNTTRQTVQFQSRKRLDIVTKYNQQKCYNLTLDVDFLIIGEYLNKSSKIFWKKKLNMIVVAAVYAVFIEFEIVNFSSKTSITTSTFVVNVTFVVIDSLLKTQLFSDITVYDSSKIVVRLIVVTKEFLTIWNDQSITVNISKNQWMFIDLKSDVSIKSTKIYSVELKKRKIIDDIFDKMHVDDKMI